MTKKLVQEVLEMNDRHSRLFLEHRADRERHHAEHPTNYAVAKCMDGRVNWSGLTLMPRGIVRPFRNIGGIFDLGWTALSLKVERYVRASLEKDRNILFVVTYHYSEGHTHRGCRGHDYDKNRAIASASALADQFRAVFLGYDKIYTVLVGVETDDETLCFHGRDGRIVSMAGLADDVSAITEVIGSLYPDMSPEIARDLVPVMSGNIRHTRDVRAADRLPEAREHNECGIALGEDCEWLPHNLALVIDDSGPAMDDTVGKAAGIIKANRDAGRIPYDKALLFACAPYDGDGFERRLAIERARQLTRLGLKSISVFHPDLQGYFEPLTAIMDWRTRGLEVISSPDL